MRLARNLSILFLLESSLVLLFNPCFGDTLVDPEEPFMEWDFLSLAEFEQLAHVDLSTEIWILLTVENLDRKD